MVNVHIRVTAAIIQNDSGSVLLCQRPKTKHHGLLWEFPGGKVESGESDEACLIRECREELGVVLKDLALYDTVNGDGITLVFFLARIKEGEITKYEHADVKWVEAKDVKTYDLCPNDKRMVTKHLDFF